MSSKRTNNPLHEGQYIAPDKLIGLILDVMKVESRFVICPDDNHNLSLARTSGEYVGYIDVVEEKIVWHDESGNHLFSRPA